MTMKSDYIIKKLDEDNHAVFYKEKFVGLIGKSNTSGCFDVFDWEDGELGPLCRTIKEGIKWLKRSEDD